MTNKRTIKAIFLFLSIIFILLLDFNLLSQNDETLLKAIKYHQSRSDSIYGLDFELANGPIYYQKNLYALGDPFFGSDEWFNGYASIRGIAHDGLKLKYNIELDQLILLVTIKTGLSTTVILNSLYVESFSLGDDYHFIATTQLPDNDIKTVFVHVIYKGSFEFLASYRKNFINDYNVKTPYGKYSEQLPAYYIHKDGSIMKINSKSSLLSFFETDKKEINKYIKKSGFKFKKADSRQWAELMAFCDNISTGSSK